ncbi:MAG: hypothetical protein JWQ90_1533 [Hydrocarboniphaga sp.]|uniref:GNAT family N-acetyltransferase n=1 Tax=Hydrocarboniphaga sp. TaxID=2033016 RepID=UPI00261D8EE4|nr:GNAT family N-acetyltransferase [Hydrocarboniphaga sp.]MDB5969083.1 hypothetical protein [Hydrocarboniphaga sp.]
MAVDDATALNMEQRVDFFPGFSVRHADVEKQAVERLCVPGVDNRVRPAVSSVAHCAGMLDADSLAPTIFHQGWWLDIVGRGRCELAEVSRNGRVVGRLPYLITRQRGFKVSVMPQLTHVLGPAVDPGRGSTNTRMLNRLDIMKELAGKLPQLALFWQSCHRQVEDVIAFQGCGFDATAHFTSEITPAPEAQLWSAMRDKTRNVIRRSTERNSVEDIDDPELFRAFYSHNLGASGRDAYFDLGLIAPLFEACRARDCGRMLMTRDERGQASASVFYVWDSQTLWYFLSTRDRDAHDNGAVSLLLWHAIRDAARRELLFDFDGVSSEGSARFFAGFGGTLAPRYAIRRSSAAYDLMKSVAAMFHGSGRNHFTG